MISSEIAREFNDGVQMIHRGQFAWPASGTRHTLICRLTVLILILAATSAGATDAMRTVLVVNGQSTDSLTIANHYAQMRSIPDLSVVVLDQVPSDTLCSVDAFRSHILQPLMNELDRRKLGIQTTVIAYSAGFPTAVNVQVDLDTLPTRHKVFTAVGSINGLTSLYQHVLNKNPEYVSPLANFYARRDQTLLNENPFPGSDRAAYAEAIAEADTGDLATAITKLEALLKKHPQQWPLHYRRTLWLAQAERHDEALQGIEMLVNASVAYRLLFADEPALDSLRGDARYQEMLEQMPTTLPSRLPPLPFSGRVAYGINGLPVGDPSQGMRYLLSTVLAVTHDRGTTLQEAVEILERAASADGTGEAAQFYFSSGDDVRSTTRMPLVPAAAVALRQLGHEAIIDPSRLPEGRQRLMGAMLGSANYDWAAAGNQIQPGGIVENLTSTSGVLHQANSQTPMIELLRGGAAGTSGTVTEPYAMQFKFPTPLLYVYYAQGCSLAEAFYLSVESPYQLLIIGDPLCRPYGDEHKEAFSLAIADEDEQAIQIRLAFWRGPDAARAKVRELELFLDGKLVNVIPVTQQLKINKRELPPGAHQLTIAAVSQHPLRFRAMQSVTIRGGGAIQPPSLSASLQPAGAEAGRELIATITATDANTVAVRHLGRRLATADHPQTTLRIPVSQIGYGPVRLIPEALVGEQWVQGTPLSLDIPLPP